MPRAQDAVIPKTFETVIYKEENGVAWITLNRPEKMNSFNQTMMDEMQAIWAGLRNSKTVRFEALAAGPFMIKNFDDAESAAEGQNIFATKKRIDWRLRWVNVSGDAHREFLKTQRRWIPACAGMTELSMVLAMGVALEPGTVSPDAAQRRAGIQRLS
jgi:hypothetical protein